MYVLHGQINRGTLSPSITEKLRFSTKDIYLYKKERFFSKRNVKINLKLYHYKIKYMRKHKIFHTIIGLYFVSPINSVHKVCASN